MTGARITNDYFAWLCNLVCEDRFAKAVSFDRLLAHLHDTVFRYSIPRDRNRAEDGIELRYRFSLVYDNGYSPDYIVDILDGPCSVLEMMIALATRCEEDYMDNPHLGNRTSQWFWGMVVSLGLGSMSDSRYDERLVDDILDRFLDRDYAPNGKGGLFTIRNCDRDLRDVEIWYQLCWYLDSIT